MISPLNLSKTAQNSLKVNFGSAEKMTSPSASPVEVFSPNFTVVKYSLSALSKSAENFVASPKHKGSSPLAKGSSVPVWPAFVHSEGGVPSVKRYCSTNLPAYRAIKRRQFLNLCDDDPIIHL